MNISTIGRQATVQNKTYGKTQNKSPNITFGRLDRNAEKLIIDNISALSILAKKDGENFVQMYNFIKNYKPITLGLYKDTRNEYTAFFSKKAKRERFYGENLSINEEDHFEDLTMTPVVLAKAITKDGHRNIGEIGTLNKGGRLKLSKNKELYETIKQAYLLYKKHADLTRKSLEFKKNEIPKLQQELEKEIKPALKQTKKVLKKIEKEIRTRNRNASKQINIEISEEKTKEVDIKQILQLKTKEKLCILSEKISEIKDAITNDKFREKLQNIFFLPEKRLGKKFKN